MTSMSESREPIKAGAYIATSRALNVVVKWSDQKCVFFFQALDPYVI